MQDDRAFEELLAKVIDFMNQEALKFPEMYTGLLGSKLEDKVVEVLQQCAVGTCFEDQIVKYSLINSAVVGSAVIKPKNP